MPIYSKPTWALMRDMATEIASAPGVVFTKQQAISWFAENYPKIKIGTVTAHLIRLSTNAQTRTHYNAKPTQDDVLFQIDSNHFRLYDSSKDPSPIYSNMEVVELRQDSEDESLDSITAGSDQFAYEADLRNYLSKNLHIIEAGLRLYEDEGITGIEFPVGGRFIDILAIDAENNLVVIELKVSRGYDRVIGQLMRYMGWIKLNLAENGQKVRGAIVAREITKDLILACSLVPGITLLEYQLALSLKKIERHAF